MCSSDLAALRSHAEDQLKEILGMTVRGALRLDPSLSKLLGGDVANTDDVLLLGALFDVQNPSQRQRKKVMAELLEKAYVRYPTVASNVPSVNFAGAGSTEFIIPLPKRFRALPDWLLSELKQQGLSDKNDRQIMQAISFAATRNNMMSLIDGEHFGLFGLTLDSVMAVQPDILLKDDMLVYLLDPKDSVSIGVRYYLWLLNEFGGVRKASKRRFMVAAAFYLGKDRLLSLLEGRAIASLNEHSMKSLYAELLASNGLSSVERLYLSDLVSHRRYQLIGS